MSDLLDAALVLTFEPVIVWLQDRFLRSVNRFTHRCRSLNYLLSVDGRWRSANRGVSDAPRLAWGSQGKPVQQADPTDR